MIQPWQLFSVSAVLSLGLSLAGVIALRNGWINATLITFQPVILGISLTIMAAGFVLWMQ